jgi:hypothetical protein
MLIIASVAPKAAKPAITTERFDEALLAIQNGKYTIPQLKEAFELTDLQTKALLLL